VEIVNKDNLMDSFKLHDALNKALTLSFEERNILYFKIKAIIEDASSDEAARTILTKILDMMVESKLKIENELLTNETNLNNQSAEIKPKSVFRRSQ